MPWDTRSNTERGYGAEWRKLRKRAMDRDEWLCQVCEAKGRITPATECDHILSRAKGGADDLDNLQAICNECHKIKTQEEKGNKARKRIGLDGWPVD